MPIPATATVIRNPQAVETTVGDEVVLMLIESGECIGLGETGSEVWRQLTTPITVPDLCERLRALYDAPEGVLEQDIDSLIEALKDHKLITLQ